MDIVEKINGLLFESLILQSPILSGNMLMNIKQENTNTILIEAPFYDLKKWGKEGIIVHTGENRNGKTDYAVDVNLEGGFGTHNKSEHWVNRCIVSVCQIVANEIGAEVINELPL